METPICDFVAGYGASAPLRLHMPGHKGRALLGPEPLDITEIPGADTLSAASGIIRQSEENAGRLFGCRTLYSTCGSTLAVQAMLYLTCLFARSKERSASPRAKCSPRAECSPQRSDAQREPVRILAGRNCHRSFLSAAALLDLEVEWLLPASGGSYLSCDVTAEELETRLSAGTPPAAVYLTSPDYLGHTVELPALAEVCRRHGVLLLVDNAHGAYLKFLHPSRHPIDAGVTACCDSAHKTLPVLTGGAYLHLSPDAPAIFHERAREAMSLFATTSPSYLILQSLDLANRTLAEGYGEALASLAARASTLRAELEGQGYVFYGEEPLKWTVCARRYGYTGTELSDLLREAGVECEFSDPDFLVLMLAPALGEEGLERLVRILRGIPRRPARVETPPPLALPERVMRVRDAMLSPSVECPVTEACLGRVLAQVSCACPPAVPIVACGERIDRQALRSLRYYGVERCLVVVET